MEFVIKIVVCFFAGLGAGLGFDFGGDEDTSDTSSEEDTNA